MSASRPNKPKPLKIPNFNKSTDDLMKKSTAKAPNPNGKRPLSATSKPLSVQIEQDRKEGKVPAVAPAKTKKINRMGPAANNNLLAKDDVDVEEVDVNDAEPVNNDTTDIDFSSGGR